MYGIAYDELARIATSKIDMAQKPDAQRLTREEWLARALDALAKHGEQVLSVESLARQLKVSRGSFYWHFKDRADFIRQLVEYWSTSYTESVVNELGSVQDNATNLLFALMNLIVRRNLARYDIAVRAWAARDVIASRIVKNVDRFRMEYVRSLFAEIGFKGEELEVRSRAFVVYFSLESGLFIGPSKQSRVKQLKRLHAFFTRP